VPFCHKTKSSGSFHAARFWLKVDAYENIPSPKARRRDGCPGADGTRAAGVNGGDASTGTGCSMQHQRQMPQSTNADLVREQHLCKFGYLEWGFQPIVG
jgi:hypothetical protein